MSSAPPAPITPGPTAGIGGSNDVVVADPAHRGSMRLHDRVVQKIAATAAFEAPGTVRVDPKLIERLPGRSALPARADVIVRGRLVQLRVLVGVEYPRPVAATTRAVRDHVRDTVTRLCGVEVRDVDVDVVLLRRADQRRRVE